MKHALISFAACALLCGATVWADGPGAYRSRPASSQPAVKAQAAYNAGVALIDQKAYERALSKFEAALRIDPSMYEAHTYIGYANRKLGRYEPALEAYAK